MKNHSNAFSPYKIYWAEFTPVTGKYVTKKDIRTIQGYTFEGNRYTCLRKFFANKELAVEFVTTFGKKLTKRYMVRLSTDKQVSMAKKETGYAIPYTKEQMMEVYYIG